MEARDAAVSPGPSPSGLDLRQCTLLSGSYLSHPLDEETWPLSYYLPYSFQESAFGDQKELRNVQANICRRKNRFQALSRLSGDQVSSQGCAT